MAKLTERQLHHLQRAATWSYSDGSGRGAMIQDRMELGVFERLSAKGLVTIGAASLYATITEAGREALKAEQGR